MCKWRADSNKVSPVIQRNINKSTSNFGAQSKNPYGQLPGWMKPETQAFGRPSDVSTNTGKDGMSNLISNDFSRRFLTSVIRRNAREIVEHRMKAMKERDTSNRTYHLRSASVANTINNRK